MLRRAHKPRTRFTSPIGRGRRAASGDGLRTRERSEPPHPNPLPSGEKEQAVQRGEGAVWREIFVLFHEKPGRFPMVNGVLTSPSLLCRNPWDPWATGRSRFVTACP